MTPDMNQGTELASVALLLQLKYAAMGLGFMKEEEVELERACLFAHARNAPRGSEALRY